MTSRAGGTDRISTKTKLAPELTVLGQVLVRAREARGLKQLEVARRLGLPASYLSKVEKGTRRLDVIELLRICEAIEADPSEIIRELVQALAARP